MNRQIYPYVISPHLLLPLPLFLSPHFFLRSPICATTPPPIFLPPVFPSTTAISLHHLHHSLTTSITPPSITPPPPPTRLPPSLLQRQPFADMTLTQSTQFLMDTTMTIVYYARKITTDADGVKFECYDPKIFRIKEDITIEELRQKIYEKIRPRSRRVSEIFYRCLVTVASGRVQY